MLTTIRERREFSIPFVKELGRKWIFYSGCKPNQPALISCPIMEQLPSSEVLRVIMCVYLLFLCRVYVCKLMFFHLWSCCAILLKFIYSENATKFEKISHLLTKQLFLLSSVKTSGIFFLKFLWPSEKSWPLSNVENPVLSVLSLLRNLTANQVYKLS